MTTNLVIGIVGVERAGKDTVADYLIKNYNFKKHSMADPIRDISKIMFSWSQNQLLGPEKDIVDPNTNIKPREFFKWFGTDICQFAIYSQFPDLAQAIPPRTIWAKIMSRFIEDNKLTANIIIPDIRFVHEADELIKAGGILVRLSRAELENPGQCDKYDLPVLMHDSKYMPAYTIHNNTDITDLYNNIDLVLTKIKNKYQIQEPAEPILESKHPLTQTGLNYHHSRKISFDIQEQIGDGLLLDSSNCSLFI